MAWTKQTARKNPGGKDSAMKPPPKNPKGDQKVIIKYSSDKSPDEEQPEQAQGSKLKRVAKQVLLTLPISPRHV